MKKILIVVDMQNDFIDGALGTAEAKSIVKNVQKKILSYEKEDVYATLDTHTKEYLSTQEGKHLPVAHCIKGTGTVSIWQRKKRHTLRCLKSA